MRLAPLLAGFALSAVSAMATAAATIPNQYIVTLKKPISSSPLANLPVAAQAQSLLSSVGGGRLLHSYEYALRGFSAQLSPLQLTLLKLNPLVASVEPDVEVRAIATQTNPPSYGIDRVDQRNLPLSGSYTYADTAGQGAHVYVIDTGLNPNHTDFTGRVGTGRNFVGGGLLGTGSVDPNAWTDCNGHGTHVAGSAAGTRFGVAKKATVHGVRVLDCNGSGSGSGILAGIDWVIANAQQPAVANLSLGTVGGRSTAQEDAVRNMVAANIAVAVAAGNDSASACNTSPAAEPTVLTVGATDRTDKQASYSNFGTCLDLYAPGTDIISATHSNNTGSSTLSGTSMASPHVAGALAVKRAQDASVNGANAQVAVVNDSTLNVVTSTGAGSPNKMLYVPVAGGQPGVDAAPVANFSFNCTNLSCSFNGSASSDDKGIASYAWNFGDGSSGNGATVSKTYSAAGSYTATLTVTDTVSQTNSKSQTVTVTAASGGGGSSPCAECTVKTGTLANGGTAYDPSSSGFSSNGGAFKGHLRAAATTDFDLYLEKFSSGLLGGWSIVARAETNSSDENIAYTGTAGTYRWRIKSYSGAGSYTFYVKNP